MTALLTDSIQTTRTFSGDEAANIIHDAIAQRAPVRIETSYHHKKMVWKGELFSCEDSRLSIHLQDTGETFKKNLSLQWVKVYFEVAKNRYLFKAQKAETMTGPSAKILVVQKPASVCLVERRRTVRRRLRRPMVVHLSYTEGKTTWQSRATMLNASEQGLACRIEKQDVHVLSIGQVLNVEFRLGGETKLFKRTVTIVNITESGSEEQAVLGMEYVEGSQLEDERSRLQNALRATM